MAINSEHDGTPENCFCPWKENFEYHSALRRSLFSYIPPYIRFSSHNIKGESFPLPLQKLLKWKISSVTPIVVSQTVQNSGFKLVKSELKVKKKTDRSGVTLPIVDSVVPPPNELMMLPKSESNDWVGTWDKRMKSFCFKTLWEQQKLNHFPGTYF